jgi:hypothetical protein
VEWWNGGMAEWRNGGMAEWQNGGMAEWQNGRMAEWRNGGMAEWQNGRMYTTKKYGMKIRNVHRCLLGKAPLGLLYQTISITVKPCTTKMML